MRLVYLDESGISNLAHEPIVVVAGVIVHGDGQLRDVEARLTELADQYAPPHARDGFIFHAKDIYSGGAPFTRELYPDPIKRWEILQALCDLPYDMSLPVVFGWADRKDLAESYAGTTKHDLAVAGQGIASCVCTFAIERHMQTLPNDEVTMLIYEDNQNCKNLVADMQRQYRTGGYREFTTENSGEWVQGVLPLKHIIGEPVFSTKRGASILQIADACAFALKRRMMGSPESPRFLTKLEGQLVTKPKEWPALKASSPGQPA